MPKPDERREEPKKDDQERGPKGLTARNRRLGRLCGKKARCEKVCVGKDWSHDGFGRPVRVMSPEGGEPSPDGSQTPAAHDVFEERHVWELADLSPQGKAIRLLFLRFHHEGVMVLPEGVPSGSPFCFKVEQGKVWLRPAPAVDYEVEVVLEGDPPPTQPSREDR